MGKKEELPCHHVILFGQLSLQHVKHGLDVSLLVLLEHSYYFPVICLSIVMA